jgi:hypothetical protein
MAKTSRFWGSRFAARISNNWQLDCLSGKAPDFSRKDPLESPAPRVTPNRRFEFHKRNQLFIRVHNETLFRPYDRATVGVLVVVGAGVCVAVAVAVDGADAVAVAVGRGVAVAVAVNVAVVVGVLVAVAVAVAVAAGERRSVARVISIRADRIGSRPQ